MKKNEKIGSFNGTESRITKRFRNSFSELYNDDHEAVIISKKQYRHNEPEADLAFGYQYAVTVCDVMGFTGEPVNEDGSETESNICISLYLIPDPEDWCDEALEKMAEIYGYENEPVEQMKKTFNARDVIENGYGIFLGKDSVSYNVKQNPEGYYDPLKNRKVIRMLDVIASQLDFIDSTRGFRIDGYQNRIGTTGWDILDAALHGGDPIKKTIERNKK